MSKPNKSVGQKIAERLQNFVDTLKGSSSAEILENHNILPRSFTYNLENPYSPNWNPPKMTRLDYLINCRLENDNIRKEYGPILITYIRKISSIILPGRKFTNEELLRFYHSKFQNVPIGCVVAIKIDNEIHYGWSLCNKKDRFNKVICLNRALNRAINGDGNLSYYNEECPPLVNDYLGNMEVRANKYFNKYDH